MEVKEFSINGPLLITPKIHSDSRGFFCERYREDQFNEIGINTHFLQDNFSRSTHGILRGLHYQWDKPQGKLVTCSRGKILDVAVDIRSQSPTFGKYLSVELDGQKPQWFWIPAGFAHGFLVLSPEGADLTYKVNAYWNGQGESGIHWQDPEFKIHWPLTNPILSEKDQKAQSFAEYKSNPKF